MSLPNTNSFRVRLFAGALTLTTALIFCLASLAEAQTAQLNLRTYQAPETCPTSDEFRALVLARLGRDPFVPSSSTTLTVRVVDGEARFSAVVQVASSEPWMRQMADVSCSELVETIAVAVAFFVDDLQTRTSDVVPPPTNMVPACEPALMPEPDQDRSREMVEMRLEVGVLAHAWTVPGVGPGARATLGALVNQNLFLGAEAYWLLGVAEYPEAQLVANAVEAGLVGCAMLNPFSICGLVHAGVVSVDANRVLHERTAVQPSMDAGARLAVDVALAEGPFRLVLFGDVLVNLLRPQINVDTVELWRAAPVGIVLGATLCVLP